MAGRPPTPIAIRQLTGNPGKRAIPTDVPAPTAGLGKPPTWLSRDARRHWRQIEPLLSSLGVLAVPDTLAFALLCDALAEYTEARQVIAAWRRDYNEVRPHGSIGRVPPAQFAEQHRRHAGDAARHVTPASNEIQ